MGKTKSKSTPIDKYKFTVEELFTSKDFSKRYQRDLAKALLKNERYTVSEAKKILDGYYSSGK